MRWDWPCRLTHHPWRYWGHAKPGGVLWLTCARLQVRVLMKSRTLVLADDSDVRGLVAGLGINRRDHGHAWTQHVGLRLCRVQDDFHGNALHHLCEVTCSIIRRQQRELLPACR